MRQAVLNVTIDTTPLTHRKMYSNVKMAEGERATKSAVLMGDRPASSARMDSVWARYPTDLLSEEGRPVGTTRGLSILASAHPPVAAKAHRRRGNAKS